MACAKCGTIRATFKLCNVGRSFHEIENGSRRAAGARTARGMRGGDTHRPAAGIRHERDRAVFHATIAVTPKPGATTAWISGDNERWIELMFTPQGWQITQLASSPLADAGAAPVAAETPVQIAG